MAFAVSPSVTIREIDLTAIVPQVSTTEAALGGVFRWGPIGKRVLVDSEESLVKRMGKPTNFNPETFFTASSYLAYGNKLYLSRAANTVGTSPIITTTTQIANGTVLVSNTAGLSQGMVNIASGNSQILTGALIGSIVNSTAFTITPASAVLANGVATAQFVSNTSVFSAVANNASVVNLTFQIVKNDDEYVHKDGLFDTNVFWVARYPGAIGNSLRVSTCDTAAGFTSQINLASFGNSGATISINIASNTATVVIIHDHDGTSNTSAQTNAVAFATAFKGSINTTDYLEFGNSSIGYQSLKLTAIGNTSSNVNSTVATSSFTLGFEDELRLVYDQSIANTSITRYWEFYDLIDQAPGQSTYMTNYGNTSANDELHVVVVDDLGRFTGVPGTVLEVYKNASRATDGKTVDGETNYYKQLINDGSQYVYWANDRATARSNTAVNLQSASNTQISNMTFGYGKDGSDEGAIAMTDLITAYDLFASAEDVDISLVMAGKARGGTAGGLLANYIIDNICEIRKDCVVFISPDKNDVVNNVGNEADDIVTFRNTLRNSSYGFLDSGYKYAYDRYNDVYRYVPLNGDMAGLAVRTDQTNDAWWSPAGFNRGQVKNIVRLAYNPRRAERDILYKSDINPVATFPGNGTVLFGDKTLLGKPSAFDRINVRRLFIVLEKAISTAAKYFLFEFNDTFTRAQFRNIVVPYLRDIQGRRGITDFLVVCDESNNTGEVIDRNEFIGDIYIKPARSINFITLNFIAVRTGVSFSEVVGRF
jgi:hypothetical protein